jgi:alpha-D-ribose 1-methylphosphonate 5-triphosphate diphosphatase PhnM
MATPVRIETVVGEDGVIEIRAPELTPGQRVTVTIETTNGTPETTETTETPQAEKLHVIDIIADLPGHRQFKTAEEVDAYIREERDSWDR